MKFLIRFRQPHRITVHWEVKTNQSEEAPKTLYYIWEFIFGVVAQITRKAWPSNHLLRSIIGRFFEQRVI
jgi:hypothetical protein